MKKLFLMGFVALGLASCVSDKEVAPQTQGQKYEKAFEALVGGPVNPNVNWGFNDQQVATFNAEGEYTGMRGVDANNNMWGRYVEVPAQLTQAQKDKVTKYFTKTKNPDGIAVNWSDFFVQQVSSTDYGQYMNYLYCGSTIDHTFDFNAGDGGGIKNVSVGLSDPSDMNSDIVEYYDGIEFMVGSSTEYFAFHNSYDSQFYKDNYVIIPGEVIDAAYPEAPSVAGMFFVGFDYEHDKTKASDADNDIHPRDYYFNDWIVKITPGLYKNRERIMVEDLIASDLSQVGYSEGKSDWDFNDAVFDVAYLRQQDKDDNYQTHDYAVITLWAAGGTKSLTVGGKEVHEQFGQPVSKMINTAAPNGVDGLQPVIFRIDLGQTTDWNKKYDANEIKVFVGSTELTAEQGKAPQKVKVSKTTRWMKEMLIITSGYGQFASYATTNSPANWYETVTDASKLY